MAGGLQGDFWACGPPVLGLAILRGGAACLCRARWVAAPSATELMRLRVHRADEGGWGPEDVCGGSRPDPSTDPSSKHPALPP